MSKPRKTVVVPAQPSALIGSIPTAALLRDASAAVDAQTSASERGHTLSCAIQKGALVCLAAAIPLAIARNYEYNMYSSAPSSDPERRFEKKAETNPCTPPSALDLSTLQDAVSGLGFILTSTDSSPSIPDFIYLPQQGKTQIPSGIGI